MSFVLHTVYQMYTQPLLPAPAAFQKRRDKSQRRKSKMIYPSEIQGKHNTMQPAKGH